VGLLIYEVLMLCYVFEMLIDKFANIKTDLI